MASNKPVKPDPAQVEAAEQLWDNFITISKYTGIATAIILIGMAAAFVPWG